MSNLKRGKGIRLANYLLAGGITVVPLLAGFVLAPNFPGKSIVEESLLSLLVILLGLGLYILKRNWKSANPTLESLADSQGVLPTESLTNLLKHDTLLDSETSYQVISVYKGTSASVFRTGASYRVRFCIDGQHKVQSVRHGVGIIAILQRGTFTRYLDVAVTINEPSAIQFENVPDNGRTTLEFEFSGAFSCSGFVNKDSLGYIVSPIVTVDLGAFHHVMILPLEPAQANLRFKPVKTSLSISLKDLEGYARMEGGKDIRGELGVAGGILDGELELSLLRSPVHYKLSESRVFGFKNFYEEVIAKTQGQSNQPIAWEPTSQSFEPTAWLCPPLVSTKDFITLMRSIGGSSKTAFASRLLEPFFFGDSKAMQYLLRLTARPNAGETESDQTLINLA